MNAPRAALLPIALVAALSVAATPTKRFSHEVHAEGFELDCAACHVARPSAAPGVDEGSCLACHEDGAPPFRSVKTPPLAPAFPHPAHEGKVACLECHRGVLAAPKEASTPLVPRTQCAACHTARGLTRVERRCESCHLGDQRRVRPGTHDAAWPRTHGLVAEASEVQPHGQDCALCHGVDACSSCHRQRRPASHTALWSVRLHGAEAAWDRESCRTCHESGVCVRCHRSNRPLNHDAAWPSLHGLAASTTDNASCRACHTAADCSGCHRPGQ